MTDYVIDPTADTSARLLRLETLAAQQLATLIEISAKLGQIAEHSETQARSAMHMTQMLTGTATVDEPAVRPPFSDYRENDSGDGWDVFIQYPNQLAEWYPANAGEVQQIAERNARRRNRPR